MNTPIITNFTKYFAKERDVYVQNLSNTQVSFQVELQGGRVDHVLLPKGRRPLNLTQQIPWDGLKNSMDLRKLVNRRPQVLALMEEDEFDLYYENLSKSRNQPVDRLVAEAHQYQQDLQNKKTFTNPAIPVKRSTLEEQATEVENQPPDPQDIVSARIVGICRQVDTEVKEADKLPVNDMQEEIEGFQTAGQLVRADYEYLQGHGFYSAVKQWAGTQLEKIAPSEESASD